MALPAQLTVEGLKQRIDKKLSGDDTLLAELLEAALQQAMAPAPLGCGRLLLPDPVPVYTEEEPEVDTSEPVTKKYTFRGRHLMLPDAREIMNVTRDGDVITEGGWEGYRALERDGVTVRLTLPRVNWRWYSSWENYLSGYDFNRRHHWTVEVTGKFGFVTIPPDLIEGIYTLAGRMWYEREAQYADQVAPIEGAPVQAYFRNLPPRTKLAFANYAIAEGTGGLA